MVTKLTAQQVLSRQRIYRANRRKHNRLAKPVIVKPEEKNIVKPELNDIDIWIENQRLKRVAKRSNYKGQ